MEMGIGSTIPIRYILEKVEGFLHLGFAVVSCGYAAWLKKAAIRFANNMSCSDTSIPKTTKVRRSSIRDLRGLLYIELARRVEELSTQSSDTLVNEDAVYLEVVKPVKGRVYGLGSQGSYRHIISSGEASSSRSPAYGPYEFEELQRDHRRLQELLLKEQMERRDSDRVNQDRLQHMEALLMQQFGFRPSIPPPPPPPPPASDHSGDRDDLWRGVYVVHTQHLVDHRSMSIAHHQSPLGPQSPSQSTHLVDHHPGYWTNSRRVLP
ncbi:hypothetical protein Sjap_026030 [Stephania japonica]|uniref:Uncharacterized protein n=1 Tax=Stephania japonica TaxID=461633 RepID=A0AAP0HG50_9MAGN